MNFVIYNVHKRKKNLLWKKSLPQKKSLKVQCVSNAGNNCNTYNKVLRSWKLPWHKRLEAQIEHLQIWRLREPSYTNWLKTGCPVLNGKRKYTLLEWISIKLLCPECLWRSRFFLKPQCVSKPRSRWTEWISKIRFSNTLGWDVKHDSNHIQT